MKSIKRDLAIGAGLSTLVFVWALAWGNPFVGAAPGVRAAQAQTQPQTPPPQQSPSQPSPGQTQPPSDQTQPPSQAQSQTFSGTIVKKGSHYCLKDESGQVYRLDDSESARVYMGKNVKVTGQLDQQSMLIHVQNIQSAQT